jgi:hypothetical protein
MLLEKGADVNQANGYVSVALIWGRAVSQSCCCRFGQAPIHKAAYHGHLSCLEWLLARGADLYVVTK